MTPAKRQAHIIKILRNFGFRISEKETTPGARKTWMFITGAETFDTIKLFDYLNKALPEEKLIFVPEGQIFPDNIRGLHLEIERQGKVQIFVAVYNKGKAGLEYSMGIDC